MKRSLTTRLTFLSAAAALALGAAACEVEDPENIDDGIEDPGLDDGGLEGDL
ncbi:MAG: hypothetical protein WD638_13800 [Nitriliruptoraceae bacterium]